MKKKIVILGAGIQGNIVATDLCDQELSPTEKEVFIADYDEQKAKEVGMRLGIPYQQCDVRDTQALDALLEGSQVVVNCVQYD